MIVWTNGHMREAVRRTYELAADLITPPPSLFHAAAMLVRGHSIALDEHGWRTRLLDAGFSMERVDKEVRRVDALATGRLVRADGWGVRMGTGPGATWAVFQANRGEAEACVKAARDASPHRERGFVTLVRLRAVQKAPKKERP